MRILFFVLSLFLCAQCSEPLPLPTVQIEKKLVISSFFTAEKTLTVWVGYPHDILIDTTLYEANATVALFEDDIFIENLNHTNNGYYQSAHYLKSEKKYRIEALAGNLSASAEDVIPKKTLANSAFYEYIDERTSTGDEEYSNYQFNFKDAENTENYYEFLLLHVNYTDWRDSSDLGFNFYPIKLDPILTHEDDYAFVPTSFFFSDELVNGQNYKISMDMEGGAGRLRGHRIAGKYKNSDNTKYLIFRTISKTYYDFQKSWVRHRYNQNLNNRLDDEVQLLFGGESQPLFTNIIGGYGIFVAYQEQIIPFEE